MLRFRAELQGHPGSAATFVSIPASVMAAFEGRVRVPVKATVNGVTWRTTICDMGDGPMIGVTAATRKAAGIARGDRIGVAIERDLEERTVDVPADFARAMSAAVRRRFDALAFTHRKEYVQWIEGAKKPETRARRIVQACEKLRSPS